MGDDYATVGAAPADSDLLYFAFVNYTTLGYGDITPVQAWRLIGPMTAMNGILMFGWSTAVLFEVLCKALGSRLVPQVEVSQLLPVEKYDLALIAADKSDDRQFVQTRQRARYGFQRKSQIVGDVAP